LTGHVKHALAGRDLNRLIDIKSPEPRLGIDWTNLHENDLLREVASARTARVMTIGTGRLASLRTFAAPAV
jgi:hypothetical protein